MKTTIPVFKTFYEINCQDNEKNELERIGKIVNKEIAILSSQTGINDEKTLFLLYSITLNKEIENLKNDESNHESYEQISNNIKNLTHQIKSITEKIINEL